MTLQWWHVRGGQEVRLGSAPRDGSEPPPTTSQRFAGDPGVGNFYFGGRPDTLSSEMPPGWSSRGAAWDGWLSRMDTWRAGKTFGISRIYCDGSTTAGWSGGDEGQTIADMARGMLPHVSFKYPTQWGSGEAAMNTAYNNLTANNAAWNGWMDALAAKFATYAPAPVWWTFFHEPEVRALCTEVHAKNPRRSGFAS